MTARLRLTNEELVRAKRDVKRSAPVDTEPKPKPKQPAHKRHIETF
jgi:hypothetical protein